MTVDELNSMIGKLGITSGSKVLEVGSGAGGTSVYIAKKTGCSINGVDLNPHGEKSPMLCGSLLSSLPGCNGTVQVGPDDFRLIPLDSEGVETAGQLAKMEGVSDKAKFQASARLFPVCPLSSTKRLRNELWAALVSCVLIPVYLDDSKSCQGLVWHRRCT